MKIAMQCDESGNSEHGLPVDTSGPTLPTGHSLSQKRARDGSSECQGEMIGGACCWIRLVLSSDSAASSPLWSPPASASVRAPLLAVHSNRTSESQTEIGGERVPVVLSFF